MKFFMICFHAQLVFVYSYLLHVRVKTTGGLLVARPDHLKELWSAILGPGRRPPTVTKIAVDGPKGPNHLQYDRAIVFRVCIT